MKTLTASLIALLNSGAAFQMADLYTFTLADGTVLRYTSYDADLVWDGNTFSAQGPLLKRGRTRCVIGVEVDTLDVTLCPPASFAIAGVPMFAAAAVGLFDGARLRLQRAFMATPLAVTGVTIQFSGLCADVRVSRSDIQIRVNSDLARLNIKLPRTLYQAGCVHTLFDADCGLNRASFVYAGTVQAGTHTRVTFVGNVGAAENYFARGYVEFTSGNNIGKKASVRSFTSASGGFVLLSPLPFAPLAGDTFNAYPGCNKSKATCTSKFNNVINFKGFPFIPTAETAI